MSSSTVEVSKALAVDVSITDDTLSVDLSDGRTIAVPLTWYPRLTHATSSERASWRLIAGGQGMHWLELDEDISVGNLLAGQPSGESQRSFQQWLARRSEKKKGGRRTGAS
jgi:hypothetical protein